MMFVQMLEQWMKAAKPAAVCIAFPACMGKALVHAALVSRFLFQLFGASATNGFSNAMRAWAGLARPMQQALGGKDQRKARPVAHLAVDFERSLVALRHVLDDG